MATTKGYKDYILEQLDLLDNITCRPMMGGYLIYHNNICVSRFHEVKCK